MGIGVLYAKRELLEQMPPFLCGGEMIDSVSRTGAVWAEVPHKFEAGTVNGAGAYALAEAIRYVQKIGFDFIEEREAKLTKLLMDGMKEIPAVHILGSQKAEDHHGIVTFKLDSPGGTSLRPAVTTAPESVVYHQSESGRLQYGRRDTGIFNKSCRDKETDGLWRIKRFIMRS